MMNHVGNFDDITVVIRSVGERTEELCRYLLAQQIPEAQITVIQEAPFTRAIECSYEIGLGAQRLWTLVVDADILVTPNGLHDFMAAARLAPQQVFKIHGDFVDKFFGGPRPVGLHLYRTALLGEGLTCIPKDTVSIRPETHTIQKMAERGYPYLHIPVVIGLHDYEQSGRDIYRKAFVHAHKHKGYLPYLMHFWQHNVVTDFDYQIAMRGAQDGLNYTGQVEIDVRQFSESQFTRLMSANGWVEKPPIDLAMDVQGMLNRFIPVPEYWAWKYLVNKSEGKTLLVRIHKLAQQLGYSAAVQWLFFHLFTRRSRSG